MTIYGASTSDKDQHCSEFLQRRHADSCIFGNIMNFVDLRAQRAIDEAQRTSDKAFVKVQHIIQDAGVLSHAPCRAHPLNSCVRPGTAIDPCPDPLILDSAGTPCTPWAAGGKHLGAEDHIHKVPLAWAEMMWRDEPPLGIHENTPLFESAKMLGRLDGKYLKIEFEVSPADVGVLAHKRKRLVTVFIHKTKCRVLGDVEATPGVQEFTGASENVKTRAPYIYIYIWRISVGGRPLRAGGSKNSSGLPAEACGW